MLKALVWMTALIPAAAFADADGTGHENGERKVDELGHRRAPSDDSGLSDDFGTSDHERDTWYIGFTLG